MTASELNYKHSGLKYDGIIGTGGIGAGAFFVLNGNHSLGREESRSGHFLDRNDYCKQHIILHYVKVLLGSAFEVIPVGKVGADDTGDRLLGEMSGTGMNMELVERIDGLQTLYSFCFSYPDGAGGNLTTDNSASSFVDEKCIDRAVGHMRRLGSRGMVLAAPEVPLPARKRLIERGREHGLFCAASFTSEELSDPGSDELPGMTDLLAINLDEAAALTGEHSHPGDLLKITEKAVAKLRKFNKNIMVSVTGGGSGSCCWDGERFNVCGAARADAVSTAGAGDAFFSGLLAGLALGTGLFAAQSLASLVAGLSVTSPHTINKNITRITLRVFSENSGIFLPSEIINLLEDKLWE